MIQGHSFDEIMGKDLEFLWFILKYFERNPMADNFMQRVISKNPLQDICSVVWAFFIFGMFEVGTSHFWVVSMNLAVAFVARRLIAAKRPVEIDMRLQPLTDTGAESFGFPSLESHMAVVIMGHLCYSLKSFLFVIPSAAVVLVIGISRVYSRSRFPLQILASWATGLIGLYLATHCCDRIGFHKMSHHSHGTCVSVVLAGVICSFALAIEDNSSRLLYVPKSEFVKVLRGILFQDDTEEEQGRTDGLSSPMGARRKAPIKLSTPRSEAIQRAAASSGLRQRGAAAGQGANHDSFYFLQRTLERRQRQVDAFRVRRESLSHRSVSPRDGGLSSDSEFMIGSFAT